MPFIRLSDDYVDHPKFVVLSDGAFRLWHQGMAYCRRYQTDGLVPTNTLRKFKAYSSKRMRELMTPWMDGRHPLWEGVDGFGIKVHDYLEWNLSKEEENQQRAEAKQRMALSRDTELRTQLRIRDGGKCRYCGGLVSWTDRRGPNGATYDHVIPSGPSTIGNLVIACRGCNAKKGSRTPEAAGMRLLPEAGDLDLRTDLSRTQNNSKSNLEISGKGMDLERESFEEEEKNGNDAARFLERYQALYREHRHGARLHLKPSLDWQRVCDLLKTWDFARLEKLAVILLTTDDDWVSRTDRSIGVFASRASWCDDRLRAWEQAHGVQV